MSDDVVKFILNINFGVMMMDNALLGKKLNALISKNEDIKHEKKMLIDDYRDLTRLVKKTGIISLSVMLFQLIILRGFANSKNHVTLRSLGRFLTPYCIIIFFFCFIIFLIKGFDWFINADNQYSKKAAKKLDRLTLADRIDSINLAIMRLENEIEKTKDEIVLNGGNVEEILSTKISQETQTKHEIKKDKVNEKSKKSVEKENNYDKQISLEIDEILGDELDYLDDDINSTKMKKQGAVKKVVAKSRDFTKLSENDDISSIFSGLDEIGDDDEDEFENSSQMWEKESKIQV